MLCPDCNKNELVRIKYAQAWACPECICKERDELLTKQEEVEAVIIEWKQKQGHDRCHYFPELFNRIAEILEINVRESEGDLPPEEEFEAGCTRFRKEIYLIRKI